MAYDNFYFLLLPVLLILAILYIRSLDTILFIITFFTPLSINYQFKGAGVSMSFPTEPLMIGVLLLFGLKFLVEGGLEERILKHPITIAITFNLIWVAFTCVTSTMPMVSFKFLLARLWFVIPFYFLGILLFKEFKNTKKFIWFYIVPMALAAAYTISNHSTHGFDEESAHWVMDPLFNDHTSYGALLAFFYPALIGFMFSKNQSKGIKTAAIIFFVFYTIAIILSYTRAAWVSLVAAGALYLLMVFKVRFRTLLVLAGILTLGLIANLDKLLMKLEKNRQDSSTSLSEHVQSISNISSDASNLERLNRWSSAIRMFKEKPLFGFGPGTYMFKYAPFQKADEKTIISTNAGDGGNAHSEYIGPLAEQGILGMVSILMILITTSFTAFRLFRTLPKGETRLVVIVAYLGLITYFVHGALNNFLDTDKAAVPFFGFLAIIAAIDLFHHSDKTKSLS